MLAALWPGTRGHRMTFSSLHAHALPLYTSFGLDAWWPLLYLRGRVDALAARQAGRPRRLLPPRWPRRNCPGPASTAPPTIRRGRGGRAGLASWPFATAR